jgi:hypothetical protein
MRKAVFLVAALAVSLIASVAWAQQTNTYTVDGSATPAKSATKKNPIPVAIKAGWEVGEVGGLRPAVVNTYSVAFYGGGTNGRFFPKCTAEEINQAGSDDGCPKGSLIGAGTISNDVGADNNPADKSIKCAATNKIYNSGQGRAAIFIEGNPPSCAVALATAIDAKFVPAFGGKGTAMQFTIPQNLRHPLAGLSLAVVKVTANLPKKTTKVKGKTRGFFEINQKCPASKKYAVKFDFTTEAGQTATEQITRPCKR